MKRRWTLFRSAHAGEECTPPPDRILDCEVDMWCALFGTCVEADGGQGQYWKKGASLTVRPRDFPHIAGFRRDDLLEAIEFHSDEQASVVWNRGGYPAYLPAILGILYRDADAVTIYSGAGKRWLPPEHGFPHLYDIILVDTREQEAEARRKHPKSLVAVFAKPAAPVFEQVAPTPREPDYDVAFVCTTAKEFKGHRWLADRLPGGTRVIRIGKLDEWFANARQRLDVLFCNHLPRREIPTWARRAKMGVVCDDGTCDSGPRILPELLAMDIPVIVRARVRADLDSYITPETGLVVRERPVDLWAAYEYLRGAWHEMRPRAHYDQTLSLKHAAEQLLALVREAAGRKGGGR